MEMAMYTDMLVSIGYISEQWWDKWTMEHGNVISIIIPKGILQSYYYDVLSKKYDGISFWKWYCEESVADDMDGLFDYTDWRPFLADIRSWY